MELDQGGAWCGTTGMESCSIRKMSEYGPSKFMKPIVFDGVISDQQPQNPGTRVVAVGASFRIAPTVPWNRPPPYVGGVLGGNFLQWFPQNSPYIRGS